MLGRIFSKIICHSVLQSVASVSVKMHVWWSRRLGTHNHDRQDFKLFFLAYWSVHYPKFEFRGQSIQWFKQTKASNEKEISLLRISSSAPNASRRVFVDCICASRRAWLSPLQAGCAWSSRVSTGTRSPRLGPRQTLTSQLMHTVPISSTKMSTKLLRSTMSLVVLFATVLMVLTGRLVNRRHPDKSFLLRKNLWIFKFSLSTIDRCALDARADFESACSASMRIC